VVVVEQIDAGGPPATSVVADTASLCPVVEGFDRELFSGAEPPGVAAAVAAA